MPTTSESQRPTRDTTQPITTIAECVSRLQVSRSWHGNKVGEAEFERDAKAHAEKYDLKRHAPSASKNNVSTGPTQVVVQNVATFKDVVFLRDVGSGAVHSVVTDWRRCWRPPSSERGRLDGTSLATHSPIDHLSRQ